MNKWFKLTLIFLLISGFGHSQAVSAWKGWIAGQGDADVTETEAEALDELADAIDGITSSEADILYNAAQGTYVASGTITAEQLTSTDDALIKNLLTLGDDIENLTGGIRWIASDNDLGSFDINTSDAMLVTGFGGGFDIDGDFTAGTMASDAAITAASGVDLGTSQALTGTTAMTVGDGTQTVNVNSSDWNISATGVADGFGTIQSDANGETLSTATGMANTTYVSGMNRTVVTFTAHDMVITDSGGNGGHGAQKLIDFPEGFIRIDGIIGDIDITAQTGSSNTATFDMGLGTATTNTGLETLAATNVDIIAKVDGDLIAGADAIDLVGTATQNQDGTSGSTDIWLCVAIIDADMSTNGTLTFGGTIVITWWNLGDY